MDDLTGQSINNNDDNMQLTSEEAELSHTDKLVGIFTEPSSTFENIAKFSPKVKDWLIPVLVLIVFAAASNLIIMSVPTIKYQIQQKQIEKIEKSLDEEVAKGNLSRQAADERLEQTRNMMQNVSGGIFVVFQVISIVIMLFITFFIVSLIYFAAAKLILKGEGNYSSAMVANGLPYYISIISVIVMTIASLALGRFVQGTSIASFLGMDRTAFPGFLLGKLDIFVIWMLIVLSIGLAKMFHSRDTKKYIIVVFGIWVFWILITYALAQAVPALEFLLEI